MKSFVNLQLEIDSLHSSSPLIFALRNERILSLSITASVVGNDMRDWFVGQKIVCVNAQPIDGVRNRFVDEYLKEGKIYKIRKIIGFNFKFPQKGEERLAFRLEGIVPYLIDGIEYAFFNGRFKPLEDEDEDHEIDISIFLNGLRQVNEGSFVLRNEDARELEPVTSGRVAAEIGQLRDDAASSCAIARRRRRRGFPPRRGPRG
jgi:hypothetical protein